MLFISTRKHFLRSVITPVLFLFALTSVNGVKAADFSRKQNNDQPGIPLIYMSGAIKKGDTAKLIQLLREDLENVLFLKDVWLDSPGGDLNEAILIGALIEKIGLYAIVPTGASCASACFFIWVSAPGRLAEGDLVIHRPYFDMRNNPESGAAFEEMYRVTNEATRQYLRQRNVPAYLIDVMMSRSSADGYILSDRDRRNIGLSSPARMEYMIQNCGFPSEPEIQKVLARGGFSTQELASFRECSMKLYEMQRFEFFFGEKAQIARDLFSHIYSLPNELERLDPEASLIVAESMNQIINSKPPEEWVSAMMDVFNGASKRRAVRAKPSGTSE